MQRIILSGIKHCGKSTIGWDLSSKLGLYFADLDDLILRDAAIYKTIRDLYRDLGSDGFQRQEYESLDHFLKANKNKSFVLSLGGGTIENTGAITILKDSDVQTYYLDAEMSDLYARIVKGGIPPFLEGTDPQKAFEKMYNRRSEMYKNWADFQINTRGYTPVEIASIILQKVN